MIRLAVFDMAGTTVDEDNVVYKTLRDAINAAGYQLTLEQVLQDGAGKEKRDAIRDVLHQDGQQISEDGLNALFSSFRQKLKVAYEELEVREVSGAARLFEELRRNGAKVVLNTGYDRATAERLLQKLKWETGRDIDGLVTASDVSRNRPYPDMIEAAMDLAGVEAAVSVAKIGDSAIDIEEGRNANCGLAIGITTGAQTREQLLKANPNAIVDQLSELPSILL